MHGYACNSDVTTQANVLFDEEGSKQALAKHVYQMVFAGNDGSTFPVGFWPVKNWNSVDVLSTALEAIEMLRRKDFTVS